MRKRPTPETDAVAAYEGNWDTKALRMTAHSRKLERERDEAREQVKELIYIAGRAIDLAELDFENDKFGVVSELRSDLAKIKKSK